MAKPAVSTVGERLEHIRQATHCPGKSRFAKWIGAESPQAVSNWVLRDSLPRDGALQISKATGASLDWLLAGNGEPFPNGAKPYPGAAPAPGEAEQRIRELQDEVQLNSTMLSALAAAISATSPAASDEVSRRLRAIAGSGSMPPGLVLVVHAAEAARPQSQPARRGAPPKAGGKPPRKGQ